MHLLYLVKNGIVFSHIFLHRYFLENLYEFALFLKKGSIAIINYTEKVIPGDIILVKIIKTELVALKKILLDGKNYFLKSIDPNIKSIEKLTKNHLILGVLVEIRYDTQDVETTNISYSKVLQTSNKRTIKQLRPKNAL